MKLLVVEDDPLVGPAIQAVLEREGYEVAGIATTPVKAARLARQGGADLALIDFKLARGGDGLDAAKRLHEEFGIPALIITGYGLQAKEIGNAALGILHKPFSPGVLLRAVAIAGEMLAGRKPVEAPRQLELRRGS